MDSTLGKRRGERRASLIRALAGTLWAGVLVTSGAACSDDGVVPSQDSAGTSSSGQTTAPPPGGSEGEDAPGTSSGSPGGTASTSSGPAGTEGTTAGTEGTSTGAPGTSTGGTEGTGTSSGSDGGSTTGCEPLADGAAIGQDCGPAGVACPPAYTCQPFAGFVFQETCQILCTQDCECPMGLTCQMVVDKTGIPWTQCQ